MIRGISNTTDTACHLSSALLILRHCLVPLRKALVHQYSNTFAASPWYQQLGSFLDQLASTNDKDGNSDETLVPVDPTRFFQTL
jgi:hypothetical protein